MIVQCHYTPASYINSDVKGHNLEPQTISTPKKCRVDLMKYSGDEQQNVKIADFKDQLITLDVISDS